MGSSSSSSRKAPRGEKGDFQSPKADDTGTGQLDSGWNMLMVYMWIHGFTGHWLCYHNKSSSSQNERLKKKSAPSRENTLRKSPKVSKMKLTDVKDAEDDNWSVRVEPNHNTRRGESAAKNVFHIDVDSDRKSNNGLTDCDLRGSNTTKHYNRSYVETKVIPLTHQTSHRGGQDLVGKSGNLTEMTESPEAPENGILFENSQINSDQKRERADEQTKFKIEKPKTEKCKPCRRRNIIGRMIFAFNATLMALNLIRYVAMFILWRSVDSGLVATVIIFFFFLWSFYFYVASFAALKRHLPDFIRQTTAYNDIYKISFERKRIQKRLNNFIRLSFFFQILFTTSGIIGLNTFMPSFRKQLYPFDKLSGTLLYVATVFFAVLVSISFSTVNVFSIFFDVHAYVLEKEFKTVSTLFKKMIDSKERLTGIRVPMVSVQRGIQADESRREDRHDGMEAAFDYLHGKHRFLCDMLAKSQGCLRHFVSMAYIFGIPMFCAIIYGLGSSSLYVDEMVFMGYLMLDVVIAMFFTTVLGICVNDAAHGPQDVIYAADWSQFSNRLLHKVQLFASRLGHTRIGYDVYGLFVIDRSTVLMIVGTLVTYTVVVIQFQEADATSRADHNSTTASY